MNGIRDDFNPKFVYFAPVSQDLPAYVDDAIRTFCGETCLPVGDFVIEHLGHPAEGTMRVDLWVEDLGDDSCTYGFLVSSANGAAPYARGERTVRKSGTRRSERRLLRDLHAFA